jgi:hypothetical protein
MIIFRYGEDFEKRKSFDKKLKTSNDVLAGENILSLQKYLAEDLFGDIKVVRFEDWNKEEYREFIYKNAEEMVKSKNTFIFDELKVLPAIVQKFERLGATVLDASAAKKEFDTFGFLRNMLVDKSKNKKDVWLQFLELKALNDFELFAGAFTWYISDIISKKTFTKFSEDKLKDIFYQFLLIKKGGYKETEDFWTKFEKIILEN